MKIYPGLTIRGVLGGEMNVRSVSGDIVSWGGYDEEGHCAGVFRSTVPYFATMAREAIYEGRGIYSLLHGQPERRDGIVGVCDPTVWS